jgi:DNA repair exonuclease SbcCD ATPase subunit
MNHFTFDGWSAKNYNSWERLEFKVKPGRHLITGINGSGKSSIFELPSWILFKHFSKDKDPSFQGKGNCETSINFKKNQERYSITRYFKDEKYENKVKILFNDEDLSLRKNSGTEKEIPNIIEITEDLFISTITVLQGLPNNFSTLTPVIRKSIIESMVGFSVWVKYTQLIKAYAREKTLENNTVQDKYNTKKEEMINLNSKIEALNNYNPVSDDDIKNIKQQIFKVIKEIEALKLERNNITNNNSLEITKHIKELYSSFHNIGNKISNLNDVITNKICPTCTQLFPEEKISNAEKEIKFLEPKFNKLKESINELESIFKLVNENELKISNNERDKTNLQNQVINLVSKRESAIIDIEVLTIKLNELVNEVNSVKQENDSLNEIINGTEYLSNLLLPSSKFRAKVLSKYLSFVNTIIESVCPLIFPNISFKLILDTKEQGIEIEVTYNGKPYSYKKLSGGQRRRVDIISILSFQKFLLENSGISSNMLVFDEIFDSLDSEGITSILNSMDTLFGKNTAIYIITHNQGLKSMFDSVINIKIENERSYFDNESRN